MAGIDYREMGLGLHAFRASRVSANSRSSFFIARYMASRKPFESTPKTCRASPEIGEGHKAALLGADPK